jgi:hypothetical protein
MGMQIFLSIDIHVLQIDLEERAGWILWDLVAGVVSSGWMSKLTRLEEQAT